MARAEGTFSGRSQFRLIMDTSEASVNTANNTSAISWSVYIYMDVATTSYDLGTSSSWSASINGVSVGSGNYSYDFRGQSAGYSLTLGSGTYTYTHLSNGTGNPTIATSSTAASPLGSASGSSTQPVTDIARPPQAPAAPALSRNSTGSTITITSAIASSATGSPAPPTITDYKYRYSTDNSAWTEVTGMGTGRIATFGPSTPIAVSTTQLYYFQTAATNSEGYGPWSASGTSAGVPSAPISISTTRTARDVLVSIGSSSSNGGSPITGYYVQYSSNSGSTWSSAQLVTGGSYTYTGLTAGLTYRFRAYATNAVGSSAFATATDLFVPAGGKKWDGSVWASTTTAKRWDGSAWADLVTAKRWNGSSWVDLS